MKVVLDTNVLLAAFGTRGLCEAVFTVCLESHQIILSEHILNELKDHLTSKFHLPKQQARDVITFLSEQCLLVKPADVPSSACRDRDVEDLPVLGTAIAAEADCLITGDRDMLTLKEYGGVAILDPRSFYDRLRSDSP